MAACSLPEEPISWVNIAAGGYHTIVVCSNGRVLALGGNDQGQCSLPDLELKKDPQAEHVVVAVAGKAHTVLVQSSGCACAFGCNEQGQCDNPVAPPDVHFVAAAAGGCHTVLLRSDGRVTTCGQNDAGQLDIPEPPAGGCYTAAAAGYFHTVVLGDNGQAVAVGLNNFGQCDLPALPEGLRYTAVAAGSFFTMLVRSDGCAVACGLNNYGQIDIPESKGANYVAVAAGCFHAVLLRDDGHFAACGQNDAGQLNIPTPPEGIHYVDVACGGMHTVLLASDGQVIACGLNDYGQCNVPEPAIGLSCEVGGGRDSPLLVVEDSLAEAVEDSPDSALPRLPSPDGLQNQGQLCLVTDSADLTDFMPCTPGPSSRVLCSQRQESGQELQLADASPTAIAKLHGGASMSACSSTTPVRLSATPTSASPCGQESPVSAQEERHKLQLSSKSSVETAQSPLCKAATSSPCTDQCSGEFAAVKSELDEAIMSVGYGSSQDGILSGRVQSEPGSAMAEVETASGTETVRDLVNKFEQLGSQDCHAPPEDCASEESVSEELEEERADAEEVAVAEEDIAVDEDSVPEELESSLSQLPDSPRSANKAVDTYPLSARSAELEESLPALTPRGQGKNQPDTLDSSRSGGSSPVASEMSAASTLASDYEGFSPREAKSAVLQSA